MSWLYFKNCLSLYYAASLVDHLTKLVSTERHGRHIPVHNYTTFISFSHISRISSKLIWIKTLYFTVINCSRIFLFRSCIVIKTICTIVMSLNLRIIRFIIFFIYYTIETFIFYFVSKWMTSSISTIYQKKLIRINNFNLD